MQAPCVTLLSAGLVSRSQSCCCDNYGIVKPNLIRADGFMAVAHVVAGAARLQRLPLDRSGRATALMCSCLFLLCSQSGDIQVLSLTGAHALPFTNVQCHPGKLKFSASKHGIQEVFSSVLCENINHVFFCDLILRHS